MDPCRARLLREDRQRLLHLSLHRHHEVGQLVDDNHDVGKRAVLKWQWQCELVFTQVALGPAGGRVRSGMHQLSAFDHLPIEIVEIARTVGVEQFVSPLHLHDGPFERLGRVLVAGHHRMPEMGQCVVDRELHHLGIDHQHAELFRRIPIDQTRDDPIDAHGFSGARGAGDEQVGHLAQVSDHRLPLEIATQRDGERRPGPIPLRRVEQLSEGHDLRRGIGNLHSHGRLPRDRSDDANGLGPHGEGQVIGQRGDPSDFHARGGSDLVLRHHRTCGPPDDRSLDAEGA
jgi:hypothetical protein